MIVVCGCCLWLLFVVVVCGCSHIAVNFRRDPNSGGRVPTEKKKMKEGRRERRGGGEEKG